MRTGELSNRNQYQDFSRHNREEKFVKWTKILRGIAFEISPGEEQMLHGYSF